MRRKKRKRKQKEEGRRRKRRRLGKTVGRGGRSRGKYEGQVGRQEQTRMQSVSLSLVACRLMGINERERERDTDKYTIVLSPKLNKYNF